MCSRIGARVFRSAIVSATALALATSAHANFVGYTVEQFQLASGNWAVNVYANFTSANDRVLNVYNTNILATFPNGFHQSEADPFWKAGISQNKYTSDDSWVVVGANPDGSGNAGGPFNGLGSYLTGDPNFVNFTDDNSSTDFSYIEGIGTGAGWYNGNPANSYGYAFDSAPWGGHRVLLAHLVSVGNVGSFTWNSTLTVKLDGATQSQSGIGGGTHYFWMPGPGALGLFAIASVRGPRRR